MLFKEIIEFYSEKHKKPINTKLYIIKTGGTYIYYYNLKGQSTMVPACTACFNIQWHRSLGAECILGFNPLKPFGNYMYHLLY
jgi:hypothetical protein